MSGTWTKKTQATGTRQEKPSQIVDSQGFEDGALGRID
jgi:hypothetical protein